MKKKTKMSEWRNVLARVIELQDFVASTLQSVVEDATNKPRPTRTAARKSGDAKPVRATDAQLSGLPPRMRRAYDCVYKLTQLQMASPFLFPVKDMYDSSAIPGYEISIKRPMDLNTVLTNIIAARYPSEDMVRADVNLVFDNACLYLGSKHPMYQNAKTCREEAESLWKTLPAESKPATPMPAPPSRQVVDFDMRQRVMGEIEKMQDRDVDGMGELLEVIQREAPGAVKTIDGETVLDFEALTDYHAMRRIEAFVASKLQTIPDPKRRKL